MADNESVGFNINFGDLKAQAAAMLDKSEAEATAAEVTPPVVETKTTEAVTPEGVDPSKVRVKAAGQGETTKVTEQKTEQVETPAQSAAEAKKVALGDDDLVEVVVDGETQVLPWKEARGKISGGLKFTKNMQQVAQDRKALEQRQSEITALQQERDNLRAFMQSPKILDYAMKTFGSAQPQAQTSAAQTQNPDEIATIGDAQRLLEAQKQELLQQVEEQLRSTDEKIATAQAKLKYEQETAAHAVVIQSTIADIFAKNPVLNSIPNAEDLIRYNVAKLEPKTQEEALQAFQTVAQGIVEDIGKHFKQTQKAQQIAAAKQKLETSTIEPPGGSAPQITPTSFKKADGTVDWNKVRQNAATAFGG